MAEEKKYLRIVPHHERQKIFDEHPDIKRMREFLTNHHKIAEPYAGNILWWAFEAGWNSRLQDAKIEK